jgi:hypothetical protein
MEVQELQPKYVLVVAGREWDADVVGNLGIRSRAQANIRKARWKSTNFVFAEHPHGKRGGSDLFAKDILRGFHALGRV